MSERPAAIVECVVRCPMNDGNIQRIIDRIDRVIYNCLGKECEVEFIRVIEDRSKKS